jgi:putative membrane protein
MMLRKLATGLFWVHVAALVLGLWGVLIAIPHADWWTHPNELGAFSWGLQRGGAIGMVTGALAMLAWGGWAIGWRRTLAFAVISCAVSAAAELTGTKTGWPFGGYEYQSFLGWKIMGRVPYGVPLSWFYMGFAAYALALASPLRGASRGWNAVLLAAWLLTAWDLVLDPAMAALPQIRFWVWHEHGPYFGMPLRNLAGWFLTGLAYIGLSRLAWRDDPAIDAAAARLPLAVYVANVAWALVLAASAGLWLAAVLALAFAFAPLVLLAKGAPEAPRAA